MVYALKTRIDPARSLVQVNGFTLSEKLTASSRSVNDRITRYLINGENVVRLAARVEPGRGATGEISVSRPPETGPEAGTPPLARAELLITPPAVAGEAVVRFSVADVPQWRFLTAPPVTGLAADALGAAEALTGLIAEAARGADADAIVEVLRRRLEDSAVEFGAPQIDRWREAVTTMLADPERRVTIAPRERWVAEPAMGERVMHVRVAGGGPLVSVETEVGDMMLTLGLARPDGRWTVVR